MNATPGPDERRIRHYLDHQHAEREKARSPIIPTRVIPAGVPLPPRPPEPDWWAIAPPAAAPPAVPPRQPPPPPPPMFIPPPRDPGDLDVHVTVDVRLIPPEEPEVRWWQRVRWGYNAGCALVSMPLAGAWSVALGSCLDEQGLAGAWTLAVVPLVVTATLDNARQVEALAARPEAWKPKARAAAMRVLLWAAVLGTATALPVETLVYLITGVR